MNFYRITAFVPWSAEEVEAEIKKIDANAAITSNKRGPMVLSFAKTNKSLDSLNGKNKQVEDGKRPADIRTNPIENEEEFSKQLEQAQANYRRFGKGTRKAGKPRAPPAEGKKAPVERKESRKPAQKENPNRNSIYIRAPKDVKCQEIHDYFKDTLKANIIAYRPKSNQDGVEFCTISFATFEESKNALRAWRENPKYPRETCYVAPARPFWLRKKLAILRQKRATDESK